MQEYLSNKRPTNIQILSLASEKSTTELMSIARSLRDENFRNLITYSRKVFIPLTQLCRDVCHYCTFAKVPKHLLSPFLSPAEVLKTVREGQLLGCKEVLFTLGERPELRYKAARQWLDSNGYSSTPEYLAHVAGLVVQETDLLPHINAGCLSSEEIEMLRPVSASMGLMLESASTRLTMKGMPHYGSPDKVPEKRLETIRLAGELNVPFTSGILIGIGETRQERVDSILKLRDLHDRYGHLQEIIIQNFRAKPGTKMEDAAEPNLEELLWTIAITRIILGPSFNIQVPPNLSLDVLPKLIDAGLNDWGGVSPLTPDFVNPEAPWPHLDKLTAETASAGKHLQERLTIYPEFVLDNERWLDPALRTLVTRMTDTEGFPRTDAWTPGENTDPPVKESFTTLNRLKYIPNSIDSELYRIVSKSLNQKLLTESEIVRLLKARGEEFSYICQQADKIRSQVNDNNITYVVNRNINYTNICTFSCMFCAFAKSSPTENLRDKPYDLNLEEIRIRCREAWERGATEVCMQGGIHPKYTGDTYLDIAMAIKSEIPEMHIHAFSPLEVWHGAKTLNLSLKGFLLKLKAAGLKSLPGTAAEILHDDVRRQICPDKITSSQWLEVMEAAHEVGLSTTATIMFGHVDRLDHWAKHLIQIRNLQIRTGGFTEFVPLPYVHRDSPLYKRGLARKGPTFRETILMHAVSRIALHPHIHNIQVSWVKLGEQGVLTGLVSGANDLGGTLMNESISRAAGANHGQELKLAQISRLAFTTGRTPLQRTTLYDNVSKKGFSLKNNKFKERIECLNLT